MRLRQFGYGSVHVSLSRWSNDASKDRDGTCDCLAGKRELTGANQTTYFKKSETSEPINMPIGFLVILFTKSAILSAGKGTKDAIQFLFPKVQNH